MHPYWSRTAGRHIEAASSCLRRPANASGASWLVPAVVIAALFLLTKGLLP